VRWCRQGAAHGPLYIRRSVGRCLTKMNVYVAAMDSAREQDRGEWNAL
jgi:hypothetical protein